jgi:hypothetical protein
MTTDRSIGTVAAVSVIEAAIRFVAAQPEGAQRILGLHRRGNNGICTGCATTPVRWPCAAGKIAIEARRRRLTPDASSHAAGGPEGGDPTDRASGRDGNPAPGFVEF